MFECNLFDLGKRTVVQIHFNFVYSLFNSFLFFLYLLEGTLLQQHAGNGWEGADHTN